MARKQTIGQITYFDALTQSVSLGKTDKKHRGRAIPFRDLDEYYGKKIVLESTLTGLSKEKSTDDSFGCMVVTITTYHNRLRGMFDPVAKGDGKKADTVGYISSVVQHPKDIRKTRASKQNWLRESACRNGRYEGKEEKNFCFYEYAL